MITKLDKTASKYAQAYTNLYLEELTSTGCQNLLKMTKFLNQNKRFYAYLSIPNLPFNEKLKFVGKLTEVFNLTQNQKRLVNLLLINKRIEILATVVQKIIEIFDQHRGITPLQVYTSHEIDEKQKQQIFGFIKNKLKINAVVDFLVNKKLICGVKIKGSTFVWEKSVSKYLNYIKKKDISQVEL